MSSECLTHDRRKYVHIVRIKIAVLFDCNVVMEKLIVSCAPIAVLINCNDVMSVGDLLPSFQLVHFPLFDPLQTRIIGKDDMA